LVGSQRIAQFRRLLGRLIDNRPAIDDIHQAARESFDGFRAGTFRKSEQPDCDNRRLAQTGR
jgi:hypothetical protein